MNATALINGFLIYLLLMAITVGIAFGCGFLGYRLKKKNMAKKKAEEEAKKNK
jgi:hypothetical protein